MAATVYRFRWTGCWPLAMRRALPPGVVSVFLNAEPKEFMDVSLDPGPFGSDAQVDLYNAAKEYGYMPVAVDPTTPLRGVMTKQEGITPLAADVATSSTVLVDLVTHNITTDEGALDIRANASLSVDGAAGAKAFLALDVDGVPVPASGVSLSAGDGVVSLIGRVTVAAGAHAIKLRWRVDAGTSTATINAATNTDGQNAAVYTREVLA